MIDYLLLFHKKSLIIDSNLWKGRDNKKEGLSPPLTCFTSICIGLLV